MTENEIHYSARSWAPQVLIDGAWAGNGLRFRTEAEAEESGRELLSRWFVPTDSRAVPSDDEPNYELVDGQPRHLEADEPPIVNPGLEDKEPWSGGFAKNH